MRRRRSFLCRGRPVPLDELSDVVALQLANREQTTIDSLQRHQLSEEKLKAMASDVSLPQLRAFEQAGWVFLPRSACAKLSDKLVPARVFVRPGGQLALGTSYLLVKFAEDVTEQVANQRLRSFDCRVVEPLTFAPGLFRAVVTDQASRDSLDVAEALTNSGIVDFAEPELIEVTGARP